MRWKKKGLISFCIFKDIVVNPADLKSVLWGKGKEWIQNNVKSIIITMAEEAGHTVLWSPPHHSDLRPIELIRADVKDTVGRQYTMETAFRNVKRLLD